MAKIFEKTILIILSIFVTPRAAGGLINAYNAAGMSRRQDKNVTNLVKNVNILEFGYYIWNPYENAFKRVQTCLVLVH